MAEPFLGEMRMFSFNFAPKGWAICAGQFLPINQNQALFSLLGTMYGGNGQTTFALPNFNGRAMVHVGGGSPTQGTAYGEAAHTVTQQEMPQHVHQVMANTTAGTTNTPGPTVRLANTSSGDAYGPFNNQQPMSPQMVTNVGGSQAHNNVMPSAVTRMCIALQGIFPSIN
jgi:microcystin-dependent protein